jgi:hypothetical protein
MVRNSLPSKRRICFRHGGKPVYWNGFPWDCPACKAVRALQPRPSPLPRGVVEGEAAPKVRVPLVGRLYGA